MQSSLAASILLLLLLLASSLHETGEAELTRESPHSALPACTAAGRCWLACRARGGRGQEFSDDVSEEERRYGEARKRSYEGHPHETTPHKFKRNRREIPSPADPALDVDDWGANVKSAWGKEEEEEEEEGKEWRQRERVEEVAYNWRLQGNEEGAGDVREAEENITAASNVTRQWSSKARIKDPEVMAAVKTGVRTGELKTLKKGFGFIRMHPVGEEPKVDIFFEVTDQNLHDLRGLLVGQKVQFILDFGPHNLLRAYSVQKFVNQSEVDPIANLLIAHDLPTSFAGRLPRHLMGPFAWDEVSIMNYASKMRKRREYEKKHPRPKIDKEGFPILEPGMQRKGGAGPVGGMEKGADGELEEEEEEEKEVEKQPRKKKARRRRKKKPRKKKKTAREIEDEMGEESNTWIEFLPEIEYRGGERWERRTDDKGRAFYIDWKSLKSQREPPRGREGKGEMLEKAAWEQDGEEDEEIRLLAGTRGWEVGDIDLQQQERQEEMKEEEEEGEVEEMEPISISSADCWDKDVGEMDEKDRENQLKSLLAMTMDVDALRILVDGKFDRKMSKLLHSSEGVKEFVRRMQEDWKKFDHLDGSKMMSRLLAMRAEERRGWIEQFGEQLLGLTEQDARGSGGSDGGQEGEGKGTPLLQLLTGRSAGEERKVSKFFQIGARYIKLPPALRGTEFEKLWKACLEHYNEVNAICASINDGSLSNFRGEDAAASSSGYSVGSKRVLSDGKCTSDVLTQPLLQLEEKLREAGRGEKEEEEEEEEEEEARLKQRMAVLDIVCPQLNLWEECMKQGDDMIADSESMKRFVAGTFSGSSSPLINALGVIIREKEDKDKEPKQQQQQQGKEEGEAGQQMAAALELLQACDERTRARFEVAQLQLAYSNVSSYDPCKLLFCLLRAEVILPFQQLDLAELNWQPSSISAVLQQRIQSSLLGAGVRVVRVHGEEGEEGAELLLHRRMWNASQHGDLPTLQQALEKGAHPNYVRSDMLGFSALHAACSQGHVEAVQLLLGKGADPNMTDFEMNSPLFLSSFSGSSSCMQALLLAGASPDVPNKLGYSPLHVAAQTGFQEGVELLLRAGGDPFLRSYDGTTALELAEQSNHSEIVKLLRRACGRGGEEEAPVVFHILLKHSRSRRLSSPRDPAGIAIRQRTEEEARRQLLRVRETLISIAQNKSGGGGAAAAGVGADVMEATFRELAANMSDCRSSEHGGLLGELRGERIEGSFRRAAQDLSKGELSQLVSTSSGVHLILRKR